MFLIYDLICTACVVKIQQKIYCCVFAKRVARAETPCYISNRMWQLVPEIFYDNLMQEE